MDDVDAHEPSSRTRNATDAPSPTHQHFNSPTPMSAYAQFATMIATSTAVMFGLMYLNTYAIDHVFFSETRAYMALAMGATMAVVMLGFMLKMYGNRRANIRSSWAARLFSPHRFGSCAVRRRSGTFPG